MRVTNNDKVNKWFFYKVNGQTKKVNIPGQSSVELPDLISINQVIRNGYDVKVDHINSLLNRRLPGDFTVSSTVAAGPVDYLQSWYESLSVKPSAGLWTDIQTLVNGIIADGNWNYLDLFGLTLGMETDEQRLRPIKTTSGSDFTSFSAMTLNVSGVTSDGISGYLNLNWNPASNGNQFTNNNAYIASYIVTPFIETSKFLMGAEGTGAEDTTLLAATVNAPNVVIRGNIQTDDSFTTSSTSTTRTGLKSIKIDSSTITTNNSGVITTNPTNIVAGLMSYNFLGCCATNFNGVSQVNRTKSTLGLFAAGSGNINHATLETRLNTFRTARGI